MKKLVLDAYCKETKAFVDYNNILLIDIPYFINDKIYHFSDYTKNEYLDVNQSDFIIEESHIDVPSVENMLQEELANNNELLYICTIDKHSINYDRINEIVSLFKDKYTQSFEVVYLPSNNPGARFVIDKALNLIKNKEKLITIRKEIEKELNLYSSYILLEDKNIIAKFLNRPASMALMFGSKPIYNVKLDNSQELITQIDGLTNGTNSLLDIIVDSNKNNKVVLSYAKSAKHAELLERLIKKQCGEDVRVEKQFLDPMLINQYGLGSIIVSFVDFVKD